MTLELNKPILAKRVAFKDGKLHFIPHETICSGVVLNKPYLAKRVALRDGKLHFLIGDQKLEPDGKLTLDKPYFAKRVALRDGKLHFVVSGKVCSDTGVTSCECEICCTISATVQVGNGVAGDPWSTAVDVDLTCGGQIQTSGGWYCLNDEVEDDQYPLNVTYTWAEKNTLGSPESYTGATSGTREVKTDIWSSGNFTISGSTYRLSYWRNEGTVYQTSPSTVTTPFCGIGWMLQKQESDPDYGSFWATVAGTDIATATAAALSTWMFTITDNNPNAPDDCSAGYHYNGGELVPGTGCDKYTGTYTSGSTGTGDDDDCPVAIVRESWFRLTTDPDTDPYRIKCAKVTIADLC